MGSSSGNARFLVQLLGDAGFPAVFSPLSSFAAGPPETAEGESLVVFSQGLCPNARLPLAGAEAYRSAALVCGAGGLSEEAREFLATREVAILDTGAEAERGALVRLVGPVLALVTALDLAGWPLGEAADLPAVLGAALTAAETRFASLQPEAFQGPFWILTTGGDPIVYDNLRLKLSEGLLKPTAPVEDLLAFSHGPFQQTVGKTATVFLLEQPGSAVPDDWTKRLEAMLEPRHRLIRVRAELPEPLSILEQEMAFGAFVLRGLEIEERDPSAWPGQGLDAPLYELQQPAPARRDPLTPSRPRRLADTTWPEVERWQSEGVDTVILGLGSTEQHGPHLPFATDTWIAEALTDRLCARLPHSMGLPAVSLGCASEHMAFPGTLSLRTDTLEAVVADLLASAREHGFQRALIFSAHGGNVELLRQAQTRWTESAPGLQLACFVDHSALSRRLRKVAADFGVTAEASGHHAGELEASILAALAPRSLRREHAAPGFMEREPDTHALFYPSLRDHAPTGTVGDPRGAAPSRADAYLEAWVDELEAFFR